METFIEPYIADELGFFNKARFSVEFTRFASGATAITALLGGSVDVATSTIVRMASAYLKGIPLVYFAGGAYVDEATAEVSGICVAKDSPIHSARDFEGKTMAVLTLHDGSDLMARAYLASHGADVSKVTFMEVPFPAMGAALQRGQVAGELCTTPFMPVQNPELRLVATATQMIGPKYLVAGWIATPKWLSENRAVPKKFASVIYETARWANDKTNLSRRNESWPW